MRGANRLSKSVQNRWYGPTLVVLLVETRGLNLVLGGGVRHITKTD